MAVTLLAASALLAARLAMPARHDPPAAPPGMVTRADFVAEAAALLSRGHASAAVILCELTGLAEAAHTERGAPGDLALQEAERRLSLLLPEGARATRWGEQRLLVLLPEPADLLAVTALARDFAAGLAASSTCHAGIALAPADGNRLRELANSAELALAESRRQGKPGYGFYSPQMAVDAERRHALGRAVRQAVSGGSLRLEFQPVYAMRSGDLTGFEALIRLHDPELGLVAPSEFIPLAEQVGQIVEIGQWALEEACRVAAQWPAHLVVAVNLSPHQLQSGTLITGVRRALQRHALPAYRLELEVTEGTLLTASELVLGQLRLLRDMGLGIALDDFGVGYSSLGYLNKFPFSKLKIDRSFAAALDQAASTRNVLRAIVRLGHGLGMTVTAEGIETARQFTLLRDIGCDLAQGYLLGRPAPLGDLPAIIRGSFTRGLDRRPKRAGRHAA